MRNFLTLGSMLAVLISCGGEGSGNGDASTSSLEKTLSANTTWPHEIVGVLDIVEAGGYDDSEYPAWAVGSLITADDEYGVSISIGESVVSRAGINIDSGEEVRVWLEAPKKEFGVETFPVSRIQSL